MNEHVYTAPPLLRAARPQDHDWIVEVVDSWWERSVAASVPRLFLDHFHQTSLIAEQGDRPVGFLIGFMSPSEPASAYVHFVGVDPSTRGRSIGRQLYRRFFELAQADGRTTVHAITSVTNEASINFHRRLGFEVSAPIDGYDRPGTSHVTFRKVLEPGPDDVMSVESER